MTPLTGDSATLLGMSAGITLGVWIRHSYLALDSWPQVRWAAVESDWFAFLGLCVLKFVIGTLVMMMVRHFAKKAFRVLAIKFNACVQGPVAPPSEAGGDGGASKRAAASPVNGVRHRRKVSATQRKSMLDETSAEEDFFLNVDLPVKYCTYLSLGFVGTFLAPFLFWQLGLPA